MAAIECLRCAFSYLHYLCTPQMKGRWPMTIIPIWHLQKHGSDRLNNLLKITQKFYGRATFYSQEGKLFSKLTWCCMTTENGFIVKPHQFRLVFFFEIPELKKMTRAICLFAQGRNLVAIWHCLLPHLHLDTKSLVNLLVKYHWSPSSLLLPSLWTWGLCPNTATAF